MRILYIVHEFSGPAGTWGARSYEHPRRLVEMGHEVTLLCGSFYRGSDEDLLLARENGINVLQSPVKYDQKDSYAGKMLSMRNHMAWAIGKGRALPKPELIFASIGPLSVGSAGLTLARYHRSPLVLEVRDLLPHDAISGGGLKNPLLRWYAFSLAKRIYMSSNRIVALSPGIRDGIAEFGVPGGRIDIVPNCSDVGAFGSLESREHVRDRFGWRDKFVCIHPGAMGYLNGLDYLLDCAQILDREGRQDIHLALMGDGRYKEHLTERIRSEGIRSAKVYDVVHHNRMPEILSGVDAGIVCFRACKSVETNSPNKFFDFLAAGLPVMINYEGWQAELLRKTRTGLVSFPTDPSSLARNVVTLKEDTVMRREMGHAARALAEREFDRKMLVERLERILLSVVNECS